MFKRRGIGFSIFLFVVLPLLPSFAQGNGQLDFWLSVKNHGIKIKQAIQVFDYMGRNIGSVKIAEKSGICRIYHGVLPVNVGMHDEVFIKYKVIVDQFYNSTQDYSASIKFSNPIEVQLGKTTEIRVMFDLEDKTAEIQGRQLEHNQGMQNITEQIQQMNEQRLEKSGKTNPLVNFNRKLIDLQKSLQQNK